MKQKRWAKDHYARNADLVKARSKAHRKRMRRRLAAIAVKAKSQPCLDCGATFHPWQMQFDHVHGEKVNDVATMVSKGSVSVSTLRIEIAKCEVVCANCHHDRTYQRRIEAGQLTTEDEVVVEQQLELDVA